MATYNLTARPADSVIMLPTLGEADLLVVPEESDNSIYLAIGFETGDRVDISAFPELSVRTLIDNATPIKKAGLGLLFYFHCLKVICPFSLNWMG